MKIKIFTIAIFALLFGSTIEAQDRTTVRANNGDISDNLDLQAVASIFGDSRDLADFEQRLNDPSLQISNLDLNGDNQVDYLRVIETGEGNTHVIVIQSVLGRDMYQDVATIEVERDRNNNVQVQVVGDVYMYGQNYIYEPVYVRPPVIYNVFWASNYNYYASPWSWGYYPTYFSYWNPYPVYRYRNNVHIHINNNNHYNYVTTRRSNRAESIYRSSRSNYYERQHPDQSFSRRNTNATNRQQLVENRRSNSNNATRTNRDNSVRNGGTIPNTNVRPSNTSNNRTQGQGTRNTTTGTRGNTTAQPNTPNRSTTPATTNVRTNTPSRTTPATNAVRMNTTPTQPTRSVNTTPRNTAPVSAPAPSNNRSQSVRSAAPAPAPARSAAPANNTRSAAPSNAGSGRSSGGR
ncbi:hypothetical protein [Flavobacterium kingsejongi]|uniref:DUF3300 domain-containing protein n=1 Tax=Flavobacterium kingsejongi TaxID=1678728 RepID=A0A2S1LSA5_9FLAO|nr:hypothetical protein [Flavobacterium kingsejongi]AWG26640.1 hypothetical protein FK004_16105 [Flavobacterium kingsejongi]